MNILITGINGFVGSNIAPYLSKNHTIYGLDIVKKEAPWIEHTYSWDELDKIQNIDIIIHLAGKAHDIKNKSASDEYFQINTELTKKIYNFFCSSDSKKFIFFSSVKAVADTLDVDILTEEYVAKPVGPYGESKLLAEQYINNNIVEGKDFYIIRPAMIHGPGNKGNLNLLYSIISKGVPYPLGLFDNRRSFTSIDNVKFILKNIIENDIKSGTYNICDDNAISTNELIEVISNTLGHKKKILNVNKNFIDKCAQIGTILHLPFNKVRLTKLTENFVVDNSKIKKALNIKLLPTSTVDGLKITIKSFK